MVLAREESEAMDDDLKPERTAQQREMCVRKEGWGFRGQSVINFGTALGCCWRKIVMGREGSVTK